MKHGTTEPLATQAKIAVVILAAGASTRMGQPKQLLLYRAQTLLRRAVETALASVCRPVVVVIGAHAEQVKQELEHLPVLVAENRSWEKGMSSSIRTGLETLVADAGKSDGAVIMLCDQPLVTSAVVDALIDKRRETGKLIIASAYENIRGVPALFGSELFDEIASIEDNEGARQLIANHPEDVATICFPEAAIDVDTPRDYELLATVSGRSDLRSTLGG
jgi:molybdenum cofactor cytidylyltransferase